MKRALLLPLLPLLFVACSGGSTSVSTSAVPRHFLWRVQSPANVVYLLGSIHALPPEAYPLDSALERALDSSKVLALEIELNEASMMGVQQRMMTDAIITGDQTLKDVLSDTTYTMLEHRLSGFGLEPMMLQKFEPWAVALVLTALEMSKQGMGADLGVDMYFAERAKNEGREIIGLESVEQQIDIFDSMPMASQELLLRQTLEEMDSTNSTLSRMVAAWRKGDAKTLEQLVLEPMKDDSVFYRRFLVDRNYAWLPQVENFLSDSRRHLVVVGAAHLIGPDGLVEQLRKRGYRVEQL